jgi:hypothetical protein
MSTHGNTEFNTAELQTLAAAFPEFTTTTPQGATIATVTKAEFLALADRYPSHFADAPPVPSGVNEEEAALRARYPSMFPTS